MSTKDPPETPVCHRGLELGLSPVSHYTNASLSPDSLSSISVQSNSRASSSPDINMLEYCLSEGPHHTASLQDTLFCGVSLNLNKTFVATPRNNSVNLWNEHLSLTTNLDTSPEDFQTFSPNTNECSSSRMTSPTSSGGNSPSTREMSRRGSTENDCCSMSSEEMVTRRNSFCLADQSLLVISSLDESSISSPAGHVPLPPESNFLSPDMCEKSTEQVVKENTDRRCLSMTFIVAENYELPKEEVQVSSDSPVVALQGESQGGLLRTFVCETSSDSHKETQTAAEAAFPGASTPEPGNRFASTLSAVQDDKDVHTSTPVPSTGSKVASLPSLSESPCTEHAASPGQVAPERLQTSVSPNQRLLGALPASAAKVKRVELKKFPKSDFSNVRSKTVTRNVPEMLVPGSTPQHTPLQHNRLSKNTAANRGASVRMNPPKMDGDAQRRVSAAVGGRRESSEHRAGAGQTKRKASLAANQPTFPVQRNSASAEPEPAACSQRTESAAQQTGNQTFCFSSFEKSPGGSGLTVPRPSPKKVASSSALAQVTTPLVRSRARCSSETLSSTAQTPKVKKTIIRFLNQKKPGSLKKPSQYTPAAQAEAAKKPAENCPREIKKISLVVSVGLSDSQ